MAATGNQKTTSQLDRANNVLLELKRDVTTQDRDEAQRELNLGQATVNRYLIGEGKKIDVAMLLIEFFQKRISDRDRKLKSVA